MGQHYLDPFTWIWGKDHTAPVEIEPHAPPAHPEACGMWGWVELKYADGLTLVFDSGDYAPNLEKALDLVHWDERKKEQQRRRDAGESVELGIGISTYVEMCGLAPSRVLASLSYGAGGWEAATVRMLPTGTVQVVTGATPHGQGHETTWSMLGPRLADSSPSDAVTSADVSAVALATWCPPVP